MALATFYLIRKGLSIKARKKGSMRLLRKPNKEPRKTVEGSEIRVGTALVDRRGNYIGKVREIGNQGLFVDRSDVRKPVLFVPFEECIHDGAKQLMLEIRIEEIDQQNWLGSGHSV